jgi:hypothetical protein
MEKPDKIRNILLVGEDLPTRFSAAYIATLLPRHLYNIYILSASLTESCADETVVIRPHIKRMHRQIRLQERTLAEYASAKPTFATTFNVNKKEIKLPFGDYGVPNARAQFHHHWLKAKQIQTNKPLCYYNLALRLSEHAIFPHVGGTELPKTDYGYVISKNAYTKMLEQIAVDAGVKPLDCRFKQFVYSRNGLVKEAEFEDQCLPIDLCLGFFESTDKSAIFQRVNDCANGFLSQVSYSIPGIALQQLHNSLNRLLAYWPDNVFTLAEKNELKRINDIEAQRVADMSVFLNYGIAKASSSLQRKLNAFSHRGLIPQEDYELFSQAEWMAAMHFRNIEPKYYDRLADNLNVKESANFVQQVGNRIDAFIQHNSQTKRQAQ